MMLFPNERDICLPTLKPRATPKLRVEAMIAIDIAPRDGLIVIPTVVIGLCLWLRLHLQQKMRFSRFFVSGTKSKVGEEGKKEARGKRFFCRRFPWARGLS